VAVVVVVLGQLLPVLILPLCFYRVERWKTQGCSDRFRRLAAGTGLAVEASYRPVPERETKRPTDALAGLAGHDRVDCMGMGIRDGTSFYAER